MAADAGLTIVIPLIVGLLVGVLEAFFVYEDENMTSGKDFLKDMWHGLIFSVVGVLAASNVPWLMENVIPEGFHGFLLVGDSGISLVVCIAITIFMLVKMVASHQIKGVSGNGFKEKFWHKLLIAVLVGFAPYYITHIRAPLEGVAAMFPSWLPL